MALPAWPSFDFIDQRWLLEMKDAEPGDSTGIPKMKLEGGYHE